MDFETKENRFYKLVNLLTTDQQDYIIPNGKIFLLEELGLNCNGNFNTRVDIVWDPNGINLILLSSTGNSTQKSQTQLIGDGSKILRIILTNNDSVNRILGGYNLGTVYGG